MNSITIDRTAIIYSIANTYKKFKHTFVLIHKQRKRQRKPLSFSLPLHFSYISLNTSADL